MDTLPPDRAILNLLEPLVLAAGRCIMEVRGRGFHAEAKADCSPVTEADRAGEAIILAGLAGHFPHIPVVAEEAVSAGTLPDTGGGRFFLVDPLDGTREFVRGGDDFTVNVALVRAGVPVAGMVYAPAMGVLYAGCPGFAGKVTVDAAFRPAQRMSIAARAPRRPPTVVASRSHRTAETDAYVERLGQAECVIVGSSLKFCLLAEGAADLYPRFGRTMQWDTAAGDAVLRAAGGATSTPDGAPLRYGAHATPGDAPFANGHFIARGRPVAD